MANGNMTLNGNGAVINRVMQWLALAGLLVYVLNIGSWVGAADEKFKDAATVEQKQEQIKTDVTIILTEQLHMKEDLNDIKGVQAEQGKKLDKIIEKLSETG